MFAQLFEEAKHWLRAGSGLELSLQGLGGQLLQGQAGQAFRWDCHWWFMASALGPTRD